MKYFVEPEVIIYGTVFETITDDGNNDLPTVDGSGGGVGWDD